MGCYCTDGWLVEVSQENVRMRNGGEYRGNVVLKCWRCRECDLADFYPPPMPVEEPAPETFREMSLEAEEEIGSLFDPY